jgi:hypothetical protein
VIEYTVHVRASRQAVRRAIFAIPRMATASRVTAAKALLVRLGLVLLGRIKQAFIVRARGGTDESGLKWAPLSKKTIAYSRRHKKHFLPGGEFVEKPKSWLPRGNVRAKSAPSWMLTKPQRERWWKLYRQFLGAYRGDQSHAAAVAWTILKREGATTLIATYGNLPVEILRDKGFLLNSLSPGIIVGADMPPVPPPKKPLQVFRTPPGEVVVGTTRKWAKQHHEGRPGKYPARRLWPEVNNWPASWWNDILGQSLYGLVDITLYLLGRL